ncbi:MAG TPA: hypothetical protein VK255_00545, partial [Patescibacteria group bacterium]|nr:hypothetical protein [Patescibacteria group bacterium]
YLISVIKKEFFSNVKRGTVESFEAALHKANLALSKLAEHEHISWIGKINAICAVTEKNNIHLSQTGSACALLLRAKSLVNISEGGEEENPNPLKTFQEVVSGRLENGDKIIITTGEIFNIFSLEEIKRSAIKFSDEEFHRFLNTALVNELGKAAVLISEIKEKKEVEVQPVRKNHKINAFSQSSFASSKKRNDSEKEDEKNILAEELKRELEKTREGYTDEKTGHIYIKDDGLPQPKSSVKDYSRDVLGKMKGLGKTSLDAFGKLGGTLTKNSQETISSYQPTGEQSPSDFFPQQQITSKTLREKTTSTILPKMRAFFSSSAIFFSITAKKTGIFLGKVFFYTKIFSINRIYHPSKKILSVIFSFVRSQISKIFKKERFSDDTAIKTVEKSENYLEKPDILSPSRQEKRDWFNALSGDSSVQKENYSYEPRGLDPDLSDRKRILPSAQKISELFSSFSKKEKLIVGLVIIVLITIPYFIAKALDKTKVQKTETVAEVKSAPLPLEQDINIKRIETIETVLEGSFAHLANVNGKMFSQNSDKITALEDGKQYEIPDDFMSPDFVFSMDDLNLVFLYKNGKIISIHANSRKFQNNSIVVPQGANIISGAAYLTYGYLLDTANSQIYRYPRAEGGFGEKIDWLKDKIDLSQAKDMAINENVYITDGKNIWKFNRGKKQDFAVEETTTPISIDSIYTKSDSQNLYILDKLNSRIIRLDSDGKIIAQYYNPKISTASDFTVDEGAKKTYIAEENGISSFEID